MAVQIALLRAVNLGPVNRVPMAELKKMLVDLGFEDPRTLLQSGNAVFKASSPTGAKLEALLEKELHECVGVKTEFMVRSAAQLRSIVDNNPLAKQAREDPSRMHVIFCKTAVGTPRVTGQNKEIVKASGKEIYAYYPDGVGRSKLKIDTRGTMRGWNTVLKLAKLAEELKR